MIIILVHWLIRKDSEEAFKQFWSRMSIQKGTGLYREMLTQPSPQDDPKFNTFSITDLSYTTFINVGLWRSVEDFDKAVGRYIPPTTEDINPNTGRMQRSIVLEQFEFKIRERIVLDVISDRDGGLALPPAQL